MQNNTTITAIKALAHETRFAMLSLLLDNKLCVRSLAQHLNISEAAASQHLQILRKAGLVKGVKLGYWSHYEVQTIVLRNLGKELINLADSSIREFSEPNLEICPKHKKD